MLLIQNATNDWTKSWFFLPALYRKSAKLFVRKLVSETRVFITSLCCMKRAHYSKRMLRKQDCVKFCGRIARQEFLWKQLCWFLWCSVGKKKKKKIKIPSSRWWRFQLVTSPVNCMCHCGLSCRTSLKFNPRIIPLPECISTNSISKLHNTITVMYKYERCIYQRN